MIREQSFWIRITLWRERCCNFMLLKANVGRLAIGLRLHPYFPPTVCWCAVTFVGGCCVANFRPLVWRDATSDARWTNSEIHKLEKILLLYGSRLRGVSSLRSVYFLESSRHALCIAVEKGLGVRKELEVFLISLESFLSDGWAHPWQKLGLNVELTFLS